MGLCVPLQQLLLLSPPPPSVLPAADVLSVVKSIAPAASPLAGAASPKSPGPSFTTDVAGLFGIVQRHVPEATVSSDVGQELQLRLPLGAVSAFPALFEELEVGWTVGEASRGSPHR